MKIAFVDKPNKIIEGTLFEALEKNGVKVEPRLHSGCDWMWNASVIDYERAQKFKRSNPEIKLVNYVWDFYEWAWNGKREDEIYDWKAYGAFLQESDLLLCPNEGTKKRLREYLNMDATVVHTAIKTWDESHQDQGYVLNPLRPYPEVNYGITKKACKRNNIPYKEPNHGLTEGDFRATVGGARFIVSEYYEASTGGLPLIEGLWHGIPSLVANSPFQGGVEYLGEFGNYFEYDNHKQFERKLVEMYEDPPLIDVKTARDFIREEYSYSKMAKNIAACLK